MCGIFAAPTLYQVQQGLSAMSYRGPDDSNTHAEGGFVVGLNRLRIIDSDAPEAAQPYRSAKGRVVAFNGEIYNYKYLDPQAKSEVALLAAMLDARLDLRQYLDGEYAVLSYEPSLKRLTLYRDRFGFCPLYYQLQPFIAVSSEWRRLQQPIEVPAHGKVVIDMSTHLVHSNQFSHYGATGERHSLTMLRKALFDAVLSRAQHSDSGFSVSFSGGIDSALVVYALAALGLRPAALLTTYFSAQSEDLHFARIIAKELGWPLTELLVGYENVEERMAIRAHFDTGNAPTALRWRGGLRTWAVAKSSPTRVVLCGDGADELLGGYPIHFAGGLAPYLTTQRCLTSIRSMPAINLDRTNKLGMAHSKEFRSPFLASTLSYLLLSAERVEGKQVLRSLLRELGAPEVLCTRGKYSADELEYTEVPA